MSKCRDFKFKLNQRFKNLWMMTWETWGVRWKQKSTSKNSKAFLMREPINCRKTSNKALLAWLQQWARWIRLSKGRRKKINLRLKTLRKNKRNWMTYPKNMLFLFHKKYISAICFFLEWIRSKEYSQNSIKTMLTISWEFE